ncbi:energy transducer TonB [Caulobacter hibisci]|uniref:Energy transducer TonB n=1 Tax=Caulobacter hibisci TaxID=2035993 RepID=A0ABS0T3U7_9CAUL|nr:energy transducer TonB [Caulobacter hibisci]
MIASFVLAAAVTAATPTASAEPQARVVQVAQPREAVALLSCMVKRDGGLTACSVQSESPSEMGVGEAAVQMASQFQVDLMGPDGKSRAGSFIDVPVRIRIR